jgi:tetratricopeptide (TPR) repeat protein
VIAARRSTSATQKKQIYTEAGAIAEQLAAVSPTFDHLLLAGETWMGAKDYNRALTWFNKAKSKQPNNVLVLYYVAQCNSSLNNFGPALADLQAALRIGVGSDKMRGQNPQSDGVRVRKTE